ncbi:MAG: DUF2802 domain-containing protein, partial [Bdellovibrionota bacterium]
ETQVNQMTAILEQKSREVQAKVQLAEQQVFEIRQSMDRSLEVAQIFQDKIPHKEIIERQNTIKYVTAARLAHGGASVEEIASQVDLPRGEVEFIASVNRDRLMFAEDQLPEWAKGAGATSAPMQPQTEMDASFGFSPQAFAATGVSFARPAEQIYSQEEAADNGARLRAELELAEKQRLVENLSRLQFEMKNLDMQFANEHGARDLSGAFEVPRVETDGLKKLGDEFRKAVEAGNASDARPALLPLEQLSNLIPPVTLAAETMREAGGKFGDMASKMASGAAHSAYDALTWVANEAIEFQNGGSDEAVEEFDLSRRAPAPAPLAATPVAQAPIQQPVQQAIQQPPQQAAAPAAPIDPLLKRAMAQQKVQNALNRGLKSNAAPKNDELKAAREVARKAQESVAKPTHIVSSSGSGTKQTLVRKVMFPRIDETDV